MLQTGSETYPGGASSVFASSCNLAYYDTNNNYVDGWRYGSLNVYGSKTPSTWGSISDGPEPPLPVRDGNIMLKSVVNSSRIVAVAAAVGFLTALSGCETAMNASSATTNEQASEVSSARLASLTTQFERFVRQNESSQYRSQNAAAKSVVSTAGAAGKALYGGLSVSTHHSVVSQSSAPVVAFVASGHFVAVRAKVPPGKPAPGARSSRRCTTLRAARSPRGE